MKKLEDSNFEKVLAVVPTDPIEAYEKKGTSSWLEEYYNPNKFFDKVYALSPFEKKEQFKYGMQIIPTKANKLKRTIQQLGIDLVRAYGGYSACDFACRNKVKGVPVVVSVHDTNPKILYDSIILADVVLCVSRVVRELVLTKVKDQERVWILPNRVDFEVMKPTDKDRQDLNDKFPFKYKILHVGRKTQQKNLETVISSLSYLGKDSCLIAVGLGEDARYRQIAVEQGVADRCFFIDSIPNDELAKYYSFADCLCNPSRWEGFGVVFIEALACESRVITSNISPMNKFIVDGYNGILVDDYENPESIANAIRECCENEALSTKLKNNARSSVQSFSKTRIDTLEASYYEQVLKDKKSFSCDKSFSKDMEFYKYKVGKSLFGR